MLDSKNLKGTFICDRGYDSNKIFNYFFSHNQYFVIRLTEKRNVYRKNKWEKITYLRDKCKGKLKFNIRLKGESKECNVSVIRVRITANKRWINIFLIYGLSDTPMMLASNIPIRSKEDVLRIAKLYFNRWRIEEYF